MKNKQKKKRKEIEEEAQQEKHKQNELVVYLSRTRLVGRNRYIEKSIKGVSGGRIR